MTGIFDTAHKQARQFAIGRRELLAGATGLFGMAAAPLRAGAQPSSAQPAPTRAAGTFPQGFLWGTATAAHQVEGNNVNSDYWLLEHMSPSAFTEPSGDACDHYHRYPEDIALLRDLGFNTYRFSLEWARLEPEQGFFSNAEFDHYRRMIERCHELGVTPVVTLHHFSAPRWFAALGGWESDGSSDLFARYAQQVARKLGDTIGMAVTINEPNTAETFPWKGAASLQEDVRPFLEAAAAKAGSDRFVAFPFGDTLAMQRNQIAGHEKAVAALKSGPGAYPVGVALAISNDLPAHGDATGRDRKRAELYEPWFAATGNDDFIGVQTYMEFEVGPEQNLPPAEGTEMTQMGYAFAPQALEHTIRYAAASTGLPVLVTENGIGTADDTRRIAFAQRALEGVEACLADGVDVLGYIHWSLFDNFEWDHGYGPTFGIVAVDRESFARTPKPSAFFLGDIARRNGLAA